MAHKTKVNGTNYKISGGKTLVNGTAYDVYYGKTRIDGTNHYIEFGKRAKVVISKPSVWNYKADASYASVTIDGVVYDGSLPMTTRIRKGTTITCSVKTSGAYYNKGMVRKNEEWLIQTDSSDSCDTTVNSDAVIYVGTFSYLSTYGHILIAESGYILFIVSQVPCIAREGMTWNEWVNSNMRSGEICIKDDGLVYSEEDATSPMYYNSVAIKGSDIIVANTKYASI